MLEPENVTQYWPGGPFFWQPKAKYAEGSLLNGERHGKWIFWYKNGQKQLEGAYIKGKKTGTWIKWDQSGAKVTEGTFLHGKMHGLWTDWYMNGQKAQESYWVLGKRDGQWTRWNRHGDPEKVEHYDHRLERDQGYSIYTDLEAREIVREIQRKRLHCNWEMLVGKFVAALIKPWHVACWLLLFLVVFALINAKTPWRSAGLAGIAAFVITSLIAWVTDRRKPG
jgi:hypothetical protein